MAVSAFYYEPDPGGGYVDPFPVAYYFDEHSMTVLQSTDQRVVDFVGNGGTIEPYEVPAPPSDITPEQNGAALDARQKQTAKDEAAALAKSGDFEAAFSKLLELI
jgi:hypothetical protein